jgi:preprotein translocase subunit SecG
MQNLILVIHIIACLAIIGLVLVQKSEGGGLGIGGGGGNSLMSGRGAAGAIVRTTIIIGGVFFMTSLALTSIANRSQAGKSAIERAIEETSPGATPSKPGDLFDPSVPLLGNEGTTSTASDTAPAIAPSTGILAPVPEATTPVETVTPEVPAAEPETAPPATNPQ